MPNRRDRFELVAASALMLFTELVLIRWTGANVVYLSYFSNFVLLGSFLGIGIGFIRGRRGPDLFRWAPVLLTFFVAFITAFPVSIDRRGGSLVYFGGLEESGLPVWVMLPIIFIAVAAVMLSITDGVARRFARFEPLDAYRFDILGSLLGIVTYSALAFLQTPPLVWGSVIAILLLWLIGDGRRLLHWVAIAGLLVVFGYQSFGADVFWSPYYRIRASSETTPNGSVINVDVNGVPHQAIVPAAVREKSHASYSFVYLHTASEDLQHVLIIGAGTGNDVSVALEQGAGSVDAVEIDPELLRIGIARNPDHPFQDPRVTGIVTDGRAFLENTDNTYDLIIFALPDSLTLVSGQSGVRLESYLFTQQAFETARDHLNPHGVFAVYNFYREGWLVDRLAGTLSRVFGLPPCVQTGSSDESSGAFTFMLDSLASDDILCDERWRPSGAVAPPATDDHPFVYLRNRTIPARYLWTLLVVLLASLLAIRMVGGSANATRRYLDLFFMGAAFLLLETKSVVQFALLFGTTWFVNALVFAGILVSVLLSIEVERRLRIGRSRLLFALLFCGLAIAAIVPTSALLALSPMSRFVVATALAFFPVFVANLIFAGRFREATEPTEAFGTNLLGAMLGGALEYLSLITGYRALLAVAALLYACAWFFMRRSASLPDQAPRRPAHLATPVGS
jgi:SAM-dependent methyltransferase